MPTNTGAAARTFLSVVIVCLASAGAATAQVTITNVAPRTGPVDGGTRITIAGTNLSDGFSTTVDIGTEPAVVETQSPTSLTVLTPSQTTAGARDVVVTSAFGTATRVDGFRYTFDAALKRQDRTVAGGAGSGGTYQPSLSADGRFLAFTSGWAFDTGSTLSGVNQVFVRDRTKEPGYAAGNLVRITQAPDGADPDGPSGRPRISADGRFVAFWSEATNLTSTPTNGQRHVFVHDRDVDGDGTFDEPGQRTTYLVSKKSDGTQGNGSSGGNDLGLDLSPDGLWVAFASLATNLVDGDTNTVADAFLHSLVSGQTTRVSVSTTGTQANAASRAPGVSRDGLLVVFASDATNLVVGDSLGHRDVFVRDRLASATLRLTQLSGGQDADGPSDNPSIDDDGLAVVLQTSAKNLLPEMASSTASQVVVFSLRLGTLSGSPVVPGRVQGGLTNIADAIRRLLSGSGGGTNGQQPGNGASAEPEICASGECVTYTTGATNLNEEANPDQNGKNDVVLQPVAGAPAQAERISKDVEGNESIEDSPRAAVDETGAVAAVESEANLSEPGDFALGSGNVFVRGTAIIVSKVVPDFVYVTENDTVNLLGGGFVNGATVKVGATAVQTIFDSATGIRFNVTAGQLAVGVHDITVTNPVGETRRLPAAFTVFGPPTVTAVTPASGPVAGGTPIQVTGTGFGPRDVSVTIGGVAATGVAVVNPTTLAAVAPAGTAGAKTVAVTTPAGTGSLTNGYTYDAATFTLTVTGSGSGSGGVASQQGLSPAIACAIVSGVTGGNCSRSYTQGTVVTLTATPADGSTFTGWTGACTGTGTCEVTMNTARAVTASFGTSSTLTVAGAGAGSGSVASAAGPSPAIACAISAGTASGACSGVYAAPTQVTLTANADAGLTFTGWSGACTGTGSCLVTMSAARQVTAAFALVTTTFPLSVVGSGTGGGSVATAQGVSPAIACTLAAGTPSGACGADYAENALVTLNATPAIGSNFSGWSGVCTGTGACQVTMTAARQVLATFTIAVQTFGLTVNGSGSGSGVVESSAGVTPAIACTATAGVTSGACAGTYASGTDVTLTANPGPGSSFTGWSGACAGTGTCQVTMLQARAVTATFATSTATTARLTVAGSGDGNGNVTAAAATPPIACAITAGAATGFCAQDYAIGTVVVLTAAASSGSTFTGWSGACTGTGACQVTMNSARQVVATFDLPPATVQLSVSGAGTGAGSVTSAAGVTPAIVCGVSQGSTTGTCSGAYASGTAVALTANALAGSVFTGWSGACAGTGVCQVTMTALRQVTATFTTIVTRFDLSVNGAGTGAGTVSSGPIVLPPIDCTITAGTASGTCSGQFSENTVVTLSATAAFGSTFTGWSGACTGTGACQVTMGAARAVTASFSAPPIVTRYLAEGATGTFFTTVVGLANVSATTTANADLRFQRSDGVEIPLRLAIPPRQTRKVNVNLLPGLESAEFSTVIESNVPLAIHRTMYWDRERGYGNHIESALEAPATSWYFAEGSTNAGFQLFYLVQNPGTSPAEIEASFLLPSGAPVVKRYTVDPTSRFNIWVNRIPELSSTDQSAVFTSVNGTPIIVERAMYLDTQGQFFGAGHESAGVTAPARSWLLAEGATGPYFDLFVLLANPSSTAANVTATYLLPDGTTVEKLYLVGPQSRFTVQVDLQDDSSRRHRRVDRRRVGHPDPRRAGNVVARNVRDLARGAQLVRIDGRRHALGDGRGCVERTARQQRHVRPHHEPVCPWRPGEGIGAVRRWHAGGDPRVPRGAHQPVQRQRAGRVPRGHRQEFRAGGRERGAIGGRLHLPRDALGPRLQPAADWRRARHLWRLRRSPLGRGGEFPGIAHSLKGAANALGESAAGAACGGLTAADHRPPTPPSGGMMDAARKAPRAADRARARSSWRGSSWRGSCSSVPSSRPRPSSSRCRSPGGRTSPSACSSARPSSCSRLPSGAPRSSRWSAPSRVGRWACCWPARPRPPCSGRTPRTRGSPFSTACCCSPCSISAWWWAHGAGSGWSPRAWSAYSAARARRAPTRSWTRR